MYCIFNGQLLPQEEARLSLTDLGVARGYGVFDALRTYNSKPFLLQRHLDRLEASARLINLSLPVTTAQLTQEINALLEKNALPEASLRIVVTGGPSEDLMTVEKPTYFVTQKAIPVRDEALYRDGCKLMTVQFQRAVAAAKTLNYTTAVALQGQRRASGAAEILYLADGLVYEGATSNLLLFKGDTLIAPKHGVLAGVTRGVVLELAEPYFTVEERDVKVSELTAIDEAFLSASIKEIMPVVQIDDRRVGAGTVGPRVQKVMELYRSYIHSNNW